MWWKRAPSSSNWGKVPWQVKYPQTAKVRALSSPRLETDRDEHWMLFRNGFLMLSRLEPT